ncbi:MAG: DnaD domain protein [Desulfitobacterium hafniense]|nr:DnaD domain protein [Desulfitobacterium hafniense]
MSKTNVFGSFTQALFFSKGTVSIPKLLLTHYPKLGLTNDEMLLIIHILSELETNPFPTSQLLAERMNMTVSQIEQMLYRLLDNKILGIEDYWSIKDTTWLKSYSIVGLIDELAEQWAIEKAREFQGDKPFSSVKQDLTSDRIIKLFENELGRPLTQFECENISRWLSSKISEELIIEALRRGVSAGIRNFRYLDSILREWEKKGLRTRAEVEADDANFQARQENKSKTKTKSSSKTTTNKYENFYL